MARKRTIWIEIMMYFYEGTRTVLSIGHMAIMGTLECFAWKVAPNDTQMTQTHAVHIVSVGPVAWCWTKAPAY